MHPTSIHDYLFETLPPSPSRLFKTLPRLEGSRFRKGLDRTMGARFVNRVYPSELTRLHVSSTLAHTHVDPHSLPPRWSRPTTYLTSILDFFVDFLPSFAAATPHLDPLPLRPWWVFFEPPLRRLLFNSYRGCSLTQRPFLYRLFIYMCALGCACFYFWTGCRTEF